MHILKSASHPPTEQEEHRSSKYLEGKSWQTADLNTIITTYFPPLCMYATSLAPAGQFPLTQTNWLNEQKAHTATSSCLGLIKKSGLKLTDKSHPQNI